MLAARKNAAGSRTLFTSLKEGMQQLSNAVVARLDREKLFCGAAVDSVNLKEQEWVLAVRGKAQVFDGLIVATSAREAGKLLQAVAPELSAELGKIEYSSSVTVAMGYGREERQSLPPGFGFLAPRKEGVRLLAATFVHNKFSHRVPEDKALIRCFLGGISDEAVLDMSDGEIVRLVRDEVGKILGLAAEPEFVRVFKWRAAMAQYNVGHKDRLKRISEAQQKLPGLALAGNAYRGIGIPDCISSGTDAAMQALHSAGIAERRIVLGKA
jgi:oxygen-dependent protoporphyrinogen oxidase